jgi:molecular chaperone Hsp33
MSDYLVKGYAYEGTVRVYAAITTDLVEHARTIHHLWPTATQALGRTLTAGVIQGSFYSEDQQITIRIDGGGPLGKILVDADANGHVRGYVQNTRVNLIYEEGDKAGQSAVGQAVGTNGFLQVTKDLKIRDFFTSSAALQTGEIAEDFTYYFAASEQIPSAVGLGVVINTDNSVLVAGGFILQVMPGCKQESLDRIEAIIEEMPPLNELLLAGKMPEDIVDILTDMKWEPLYTLPLSFQCNCSKERFKSGLATLPESELIEMMSDEVTKTECQFCRSEYHFTPEELEEIIQERKQTKDS